MTSEMTEAVMLRAVPYADGRRRRVREQILSDCNKMHE